MSFTPQYTPPAAPPMPGEKIIKRPQPVSHFKDYIDRRKGLWLLKNGSNHPVPYNARLARIPGYRIITQEQAEAMTEYHFREAEERRRYAMLKEEYLAQVSNVNDGIVANPLESYHATQTATSQIRDLADITAHQGVDDPQTIILNQGQDQLTPVNKMTSHDLAEELLNKHGFDVGNMSFQDLRKTLRSFRDTGRPPQ